MRLYVLVQRHLAYGASAGFPELLFCRYVLCYENRLIGNFVEVF